VYEEEKKISIFIKDKQIQKEYKNLPLIIWGRRKRLMGFNMRCEVLRAADNAGYFVI